jgi:ABC-type branched-subunit amino acid transport system substrate-binding protein
VMRRSTAQLALVAACGLILTACASSSHNPTSVATSSKPAIKIMVVAPWDNPDLDFGDSPIIVQIAANAVNANGGIHGQQIQVIPCNDMFDPNKAAACARQAVSDHVAALVGGFSFFGGQVYPILQQANIPWIGDAAIDPVTAISPMSFSDNPAPLHLTSLGVLAGGSECKSSGLLMDASAATPSNVAFYNAGIKSQGKTWAHTVVVPTTATDYLPSATQATAGVDCLAIAVGNVNMPQFITALSETGYKGKVFGFYGSNVSQQDLTQFPSVTNGWVLVDFYPPTTASGWSAYTKLMAANQSKLGKYYPNVGGQSEKWSYLAFEIFQKLASESTGPVTNRSLLQDLTHSPTCMVNLGSVMPSLNFCKPNSVASIKSVYDTDVWVDVVRNAQLSSLNNSFLDMEADYVKGSE